MTDHILSHTAEIVAKYSSANLMAAADLPSFIRSIYGTLSTVANGNIAPVEHEKPTPAVAIKKSVFADHIICLEDGRKFKTLKRHLRASYNMSPSQYRERWGLSADYPMVAPAYSVRRAELAKSFGLGAKGVVRSLRVAAKQDSSLPKRGRGRPRKDAVLAA